MTGSPTVAELLAQIAILEAQCTASRANYQRLLDASGAVMREAEARLFRRKVLSVPLARGYGVAPPPEECRPG